MFDHDRALVIRLALKFGDVSQPGDGVLQLDYGRSKLVSLPFYGLSCFRGARYVLNRDAQLLHDLGKAGGCQAGLAAPFAVEWAVLLEKGRDTPLVDGPYEPAASTLALAAEITTLEKRSNRGTRRGQAPRGTGSRQAIRHRWKDNNRGFLIGAGTTR